MIKYYVEIRSCCVLLPVLFYHCPCASQDLWRLRIYIKVFFLLLDCWADFLKQPFCLQNPFIYSAWIGAPLGMLFFNMNSFVCHLGHGGLHRFVYHRKLVILGKELHYLWCKYQTKKSISLNLMTKKKCSPRINLVRCSCNSWFNSHQTCVFKKIKSNRWAAVHHSYCFSLGY